MNPIRVARNLETLSQGALATKLGLSRPYIVRAEQGCYVRPGTPLEHFVSRTMRIPPQEVMRKYREFQSSQRKFTIEQRLYGMEKLGAPAEISSEEDTKHIVFPHQLFAKWREGYWATVTQFSVDLCVHPYSVAHYEDGDMYSMPEQLREVLTECNLLDEGFLNDKRWYYAADAA